MPSVASAAAASCSRRAARRLRGHVGEFRPAEAPPSVTNRTQNALPLAASLAISPPQPSDLSSGCGATTKIFFDDRTRSISAIAVPFTGIETTRPPIPFCHRSADLNESRVRIRLAEVRSQIAYKALQRMRRDHACHSNGAFGVFQHPQRSGFNCEPCGVHSR